MDRRDLFKGKQFPFHHDVTFVSRVWGYIKWVVCAFIIALIICVFGFRDVLSTHNAVNNLQYGRARTTHAEPIWCPKRNNNDILTAANSDSWLTIVVGVECSGSKLAAKVSAEAMGISSARRWSGYGTVFGSKTYDDVQSGTKSIQRLMTLHTSLPTCVDGCLGGCYVDVPTLLRDYYAKGGRRATVIVTTRDRSASMECKTFWHQPVTSIAAAEQATGVHLLQTWIDNNFGIPQHVDDSTETTFSGFDFAWTVVNYETLVALQQAYIEQPDGLFAALRADPFLVCVELCIDLTTVCVCVCVCLLLC